VRVGIDLVLVSRIAESVAAFGDAFIARVFTEGEAAYAGGDMQRLASRFAAKEATKKALTLDGVGWRDLEVVKLPSGACEMKLHGGAREQAGSCTLALSMSHEADYATAVVIALASHE
jgi:holo-[acyl-carrier protein] synthase